MLVKLSALLCVVCVKVAEENNMDRDLAKRINATSAVAAGPFVLSSSTLSSGSDDADDVSLPLLETFVSLTLLIFQLSLIDTLSTGYSCLGERSRQSGVFCVELVASLGYVDGSFAVY